MFKNVSFEMKLMCSICLLMLATSLVIDFFPEVKTLGLWLYGLEWLLLIIVFVTYQIDKRKTS